MVLQINRFVDWLGSYRKYPWRQQHPSINESLVGPAWACKPPSAFRSCPGKRTSSGQAGIGYHREWPVAASWFEPSCAQVSPTRNAPFSMVPVKPTYGFMTTDTGRNAGSRQDLGASGRGRSDSGAPKGFMQYILGSPSPVLEDSGTRYLDRLEVGLPWSRGTCCRNQVGCPGPAIAEMPLSVLHR